MTDTDKIVQDLLEKYGKTHSSRAALLNMCEHCEFEAAIREAISLSQPKWIEASQPPKREGRYLIQYRQFGQVRIFVADFITQYGWTSQFEGMEILKWCEIPDPDPAPTSGNIVDHDATTDERKEK